jgi:hypothetical protein
MESLTDVRKVAYEILEKAKRILQTEGYLPGYGFVLESSGETTAIELDFSDREAKKRSMQLVGQLAREKKAVAVITVTDSTYRVFPPEKNEPRVPIEDPNLAEAFKPDGKPRTCVSIDIKVEGEPTTNIMVPYWRDRLGDIVFGPAEEGPIEFVAPEPPLPEEEAEPVD